MNTITEDNPYHNCLVTPLVRPNHLPCTYSGIQSVSRMQIELEALGSWVMITKVIFRSRDHHMTDLCCNIFSAISVPSSKTNWNPLLPTPKLRTGIKFPNDSESGGRLRLYTQYMANPDLEDYVLQLFSQQKTYHYND